jgi:hypothetical protein
MCVKGEDETNNQNIDMEEQHGNQDIGVISSYIGGEWYKDDRTQEENVNPEQSGINSADEMELTMMIQPETREN